MSSGTICGTARIIFPGFANSIGADRPAEFVAANHIAAVLIEVPAVVAALSRVEAAVAAGILLNNINKLNRSYLIYK